MHFVVMIGLFSKVKPLIGDTFGMSMSVWLLENLRMVSYRVSVERFMDLHFVGVHLSGGFTVLTYMP